MPALFF
jgi:hypothetical protein